MHFELAEEHRMLQDLVQKFVRDELIPLEGAVLAREASGQDAALTAVERAWFDKISKDLCLWNI